MLNNLILGSVLKQTFGSRIVGLPEFKEINILEKSYFRSIGSIGCRLNFIFRKLILIKKLCVKICKKFFYSFLQS